MVNKINISRRVYYLNSSALLKLKYDEVYNTDILDDLSLVIKVLKKIENFSNKKSARNILEIKKYLKELKEIKGYLKFIYEVAIRLAYIMIINCNNNKPINYNDFYKIAKKKPIKWFKNVINLASYTFTNSENNETEEVENIDLDAKNVDKIPNNELISLCKRVGFSYNELNEIKYIDIIDIISIHFNIKKETKFRKANQNDFNNF